MKNWRDMARPAMAAGTLLALCASAEAQGVLRFVGVGGNDAGPCSRSQPCRTLQAGINATPEGAELQIIDSAGYGSATINKSITISAIGVSGTVITPSGTGVAILISAPDDVVVLRGLLLSGQGTGGSGLVIQSAAAVHVDGLKIERFAGNALSSGIGIAAGVSEVFIANSEIRDNTNGISAAGASATRITVENTNIENNSGDGVDVSDVDLSITRSVISGNGDDGVAQDGGDSNMTWTTSANNGADGFNVGGGGEMTLEFSTARGNVGSGLLVGASPSIGRISNSTVTNNAVGLDNDNATPGTLLSRRDEAGDATGNNTVAGNTAATQGTITLFDPL